MELEGQLRKFITVVKMRASEHAQDRPAYEVAPKGLQVGEVLPAYRGLITGVPGLRGARQPLYPGLADQETTVLQALISLQEATPEAAIQRSGLPKPMVDAALRRLAELNYAVVTRH